MQIVNFRHPGYDDKSNIILTLQAPDDPNGGIHAETARLACCIVAGNRWDGYLSITQKDPEPAVTTDGILRRKDYYFHIPENPENPNTTYLVDRRAHKDGPYPITARFADWSFPAHGLPPLWEMAGDVAKRLGEEADDDPPLDEDGDPLSKYACRICGKGEEKRPTWLWDWNTVAGRQLFEREKFKVGIAEQLTCEDSDDEVDDDEAEDDEGERDDEAEDDETEKDDAADDEAEEKEAEDVKAEEKGANEVTEDGTDEKDPLQLDERNIIRLGVDCSAEEEHCEVVKAYKLAQWVFVPKFEHTGEPTFAAHIFGPREEGIKSSHDKPLLLPWAASTELLFAHFAQAVFEQIVPFFEAEVPRVLRVINTDDQVMLLDADTEVCTALVVPRSRQEWSSDGESIHAEEVEEAPDPEGSSSEKETKFVRSEAVPIAQRNDQLAEIQMSPDRFHEVMAEATKLMQSLEEPEMLPVMRDKLYFPDVSCDICEQEIYTTRYKCLDCENYDLCSDCIDKRVFQHPEHAFLAIHDTPWYREVATGEMIAKEEEEEAEEQAASEGSDPNEDDDTKTEGELTARALKARLDLQIPFGRSMKYAESLNKDFSSTPTIRLLSVWPGKGTIPIIGHLETVALDQAPSFEALSYTWGPPVPKYSINISGARLEVTDNLKLALFRLRQEDQVRKLWIDGICINQSDNEEKNFQVQLMRDIYTKAEQTIVWLGEEAEDSSIAFSMCERLINAHGNTYMKQMYGVDLEEEFAQGVGDPALVSSVLATMNEAALKKGMDQFVSSLNLSAETSVDEEEMKEYTENFDQSIPLEEVVAKAFTEALLSGEEYTGPFKSLVEKDLAKYRAEISENESNDDQETGELNADPKEHSADHNSGDTDSPGEMPITDESEASDEKESAREENYLKSSDWRFQGRMVLQILNAQQLRKQDDSAAAPPTSDEIFALHAIFKRPWFRRIWIIQEVGVSGSALIQCGSRIIDWWIFYFGFLITQKLMRAARLGPRYFRNIAFMTETRNSIHHKEDLNEPKYDLRFLPLLIKYRRYLATNPRDKVFALLGIAHMDFELVPDYTKSVEDTFIDVAIKLLESSPHLDLLAIPQGNGNISADIPSWVPDWSDSGSKAFPLAGDQNFQSSEVSMTPLRVFSATGDSTTTVQAIDNSFLRLQGYTIDCITETADRMHFEETDYQIGAQLGEIFAQGPDIFFDSWRRFFELLAAGPKAMESWQTLFNPHEAEITYPTGEDNYTVFARTLWADLNREDVVSRCKDWLAKIDNVSEVVSAFPSIDVERHSFEDAMALIVGILPAISKLDPDLVNSGAVSCVHTLDRRLARTKKGYLCLVPAETEVGDSIVLLQGGRTPYILREAEVKAGTYSGEEGFRMVGETYVHGIMYGEAWDEEKCHDVVLV